MDTTAVDIGDIVRLFRAYVAALDSPERRRVLWSTATARDRRSGDLTREFAYQGFPATIVGVVSTGKPGDEYVVRVLYAKSDSTGKRVWTMALQRLYAVRESGAWRLSNALPRLTRDWKRSHVGRITFWYAPGQRPDPERAVRAARFVDSIATLFAVPPPDTLDYYVTASAEEYHRILGLDFFLLPNGRGSGRGGRALPADGIVLSGNPALGEAYLHELVHATLGPAKIRNALVSEGIATWLAGSGGRSPREMYAVLRRYQRKHPAVTLDNIVREEVAGEWGSAETDALYATGALFVDSVYRRSGIAGVRALTAVPSGSEAALVALRARLGESPAQLDRWWRLEAAGGR
ncbi:MAG: hypothetical protein M3Z54_03165 [Gemmatimonadota bacterium]|nr:hypothetical protein [Gemmatimonadota bacterium]